MSFDKLDLSILKAITNDRKCALEFVNECSENLFTPDLWRFAKFIIDYVKIYKEVPTPRIINEKLKLQKNNAFLEYTNSILSELEKITYDVREYKHDIEKLKARYSEKLVVNLKDHLSSIQDMKKSVAEIQNTLNNIKSINQPKVYKEGSLKDYADDFKNIYAATLQNAEFGAGIKTGYGFMDYAFSLKKGTMLIFAGITNSGKSMILMNTAIQIWMGENNVEMTSNFRKGYNVLLFSLEMGYGDYSQRALARIAMVPQRSMRNATLTDEEKARVAKAFKFIKAYPNNFTIIDLPRKATIETIEGIMDEQTEKGNKPDIVVIDYLNLMHADAGKDAADWLIQSAISERAHELARAKDVAVLSAVQLNPKGSNDKNDNGDAQIKNMRRSTAISDNCDFIIGINTRKNEKNYPDFSCSIIKNRSGELIDGKLHKELNCCALLDKKNDNNSDIEDISNMIDK